MANIWNIFNRALGGVGDYGKIYNKSKKLKCYTHKEFKDFCQFSSLKHMWQICRNRIWKMLNSDE